MHESWNRRALVGGWSPKRTAIKLCNFINFSSQTLSVTSSNFSSITSPPHSPRVLQMAAAKHFRSDLL